MEKMEVGSPKILFENLDLTPIHPILWTGLHRYGPGKPQLAYGLYEGVTKRAVSSLSNPTTGLVALSFERLRRLCRHEKDGFCKEMRSRCELRSYLPITK